MALETTVLIGHIAVMIHFASKVYHDVYVSHELPNKSEVGLLICSFTLMVVALVGSVI